MTNFVVKSVHITRTKKGEQTVEVKLDDGNGKKSTRKYPVKFEDSSGYFSNFDTPLSRFFTACGLNPHAGITENLNQLVGREINATEIYRGI